MQNIYSKYQTICKYLLFLISVLSFLSKYSSDPFISPSFPYELIYLIFVWRFNIKIVVVSSRSVAYLGFYQGIHN